MTSFSVKKPFTVFVAVIAILVFGVMSYTRMTPDLMPNMDYPYAVIVTTYPGAAPEEVEAVVTKPMEQSMATLNDIKTVTSTSAENYSMLVLEFEQDTNMDSAVVDILQKTQLLTGSWKDSIGTPSIIRVNPNMIPVMVAAVDSSDMDRYELSRFAKDTVIPSLEGTTGVASITTGGMIERTMTIEVNEKKLDKMNEKIAGAINDAMEDARQQLEDAQKRLEGMQDDGYKAKYEELKGEFDGYKADVEAKQAQATARSLFKAQVEKLGITGSRADSIVRATDLGAFEVEDGAYKDPKAVEEAIRKDWGDFIPKVTTEGAHVAHPPAQGGGDAEPKSLADALRQRYSEKG